MDGLISLMVLMEISWARRHLSIQINHHIRFVSMKLMVNSSWKYINGFRPSPISIYLDPPIPYIQHVGFPCCHSDARLHQLCPTGAQAEASSIALRGTALFQLGVHKSSHIPKKCFQGYGWPKDGTCETWKFDPWYLTFSKASILLGVMCLMATPHPN